MRTFLVFGLLATALLAAGCASNDSESTGADDGADSGGELTTDIQIEGNESAGGNTTAETNETTGGSGLSSPPS